MPYFVESLKAYLGTGLLTIPFAISCSGLYLGVIGVGLMTFLASHTMKMLVQMKRHIEKIVDRGDMSKFASTAGPRREITYEDIGMFACGVWGKRLSVWALLLTNVGTVIGYMIFAGSTTIHAAEVIEYPSTCKCNRFVCLSKLEPPHTQRAACRPVFACVHTYIGFTFVATNTKKLAFVSIFGTLCIVFAIAVVVFNDELYIHKNGVSKDIVGYNFSALPTFLV